MARIGKRDRYEVLRRDDFSCRYCGAKAPETKLHVDHVIPRRHGGSDDAWNLTAACPDCNLGKSDGLPTEDVVTEVRQDECCYLLSKGLPVTACMYCAKPVHIEPEDEPTEHPQCITCNMAVSDAYEAGWRQATQRKEVYQNG